MVKCGSGNMLDEDDPKQSVAICPSTHEAAAHASERRR